MGEPARLFVALELPGAVRDALSGWAAGAWAGVDGARVLAAESLHVTLCFLGPREVGEVDAIGAAVLGTVDAMGGSPVPLEVGDVVALPPRHPRVRAVTLADVDGRAGALQAALSARLADGGWYAPERRRWLAHVSVVRLGRRSSGGASGGVSGPSPSPPPFDPFAAIAVTLMRSRPGSRYEPLARVVLS